MNSTVSSCRLPCLVLISESEPEPADAAAQVLRPVLHPVRRRDGSHGGDEQRSASSHKDALQVRPERLFLQTPRFTQGAREELANVQRPGLPGDAPGRAFLRPGHLQRPDEDPAEGLQGEQQRTAKTQNITKHFSRF